MRTRWLPLAAVVLLAVFLAGAGQARANAQQYLNQAMQEAQAGRFKEALKATDMAGLYIWNSIPFQVARAYLVSREAGYYGDIATRSNTIFQHGEKARLYVDFLGYKMRRQGRVYQFGIDGAVIVQTEDGRQVYRKNDYLRARLSRSQPFRELFVNAYLTLSLPAGRYVIRLLLRDAVSNQQTAIKWTVTVAGGQQQQQQQPQDGGWGGQPGGDGGFHQQQPYQPGGGGQQPQQQPPQYPGQQQQPPAYPGNQQQKGGWD